MNLALERYSALGLKDPRHILLVYPSKGGGLGPATATIASSAAAVSLIAAITELTTDETIFSVEPNDGRLALNSSKRNLLVGMSAISAGTIAASLLSSAGRTLGLSINVTDGGAGITPTYKLHEDGSRRLTEAGNLSVVDRRFLKWVTPASPSVNNANQKSDPNGIPHNFALADADALVSGASGSMAVAFQAPGCLMVNLHHSNALQASFTPDPLTGLCSGSVPLTGVTNGPLYLEARALVDNAVESSAAIVIYGSIVVFITGAADRVESLPAGAAGMSLTWCDEFTSDPVISSATSRPSAGAYYSKMPYHQDAYGDAAFADPAAGWNAFKTINSWLRIRATYDVNYPGSIKWWSGSMSTAFPNGDRNTPPTGLGYYEAEVLFPPGVGTWPSFWTNDYSSLAQGISGGREIDICEQYNMFPGYNVTQHRYASNGVDTSTASSVGQSEQMGWKRHRIGMKTTSTAIFYYLDDVLVFTDNSKFNLAGATDPSQLFLIITFALGAGWPLKLPPAGRYDAYYNYIRYYS